MQTAIDDRVVRTDIDEATYDRKGARRALFAAMSGYALDGFDLLILGFMMVPLAADLHLTSTQTGGLVTWTLLGGAIGGSVFGILADYFGRARILSISILIFSGFTFLCAFATSYTDLFIYRILAGIGLGCEFGVGVTLATEAFPKSMRKRISACVGMSWQLGVLGAALLTPLLLPYVGWRGMFLIGGLPALASYFIRRGVKESDDFEAVKKAGMPEFPVRTLFADRPTLIRSIAVLIMATIQNFGYYGLIIWLPSYLTSKHGMSAPASGLWTAASVLGMILGVFMFGRLSEKLGLKRTFIVYQLLACAMVMLYAFTDTSAMLLIVGFLAGIFVNGMMGGYGVLITSLYPTHARSTAQNVLWSVGRALGGLGPVVIGAIVTHGSFQIALALLSLTYLIDMAVTAWMLPPASTFDVEEAEAA